MTATIRLVPQYILAVALLVFTGYPFLYMVATSFKTQEQFFMDPFSLFTSIQFSNYILAFEKGLVAYFFNSVIVTSISVALTVFIAALASYPLSRLKFRLNKPVFLLLVSGMMLPIHSTLIPIFILTRNAGLSDSLPALIGPYVAFSLPISIFILTQFMSELPREVEEAAEIDGCGHMRMFWNVILPMLTPAVATIVIYNFIHIWTEFIFALVLISSPENMTLPLGMQKFYGELTVNVPALMAALTLASLPILTVYFMAQEKIVTGLTGGAVK
ncbi:MULTISPECIES: carbohydrate ABC transporter permease [Paenibacillus]|uniref:carbohydrate ABC transporter permease n=1 Tax=Paenibacillus TaxID=44249 RepID=UPI00087EE937|nr:MULTISPECIES: carbohydrate ABC transporter permease [Paenibacillus]NTZ19405.1 carbohydrate ABC transporter permease [Paenibacillus sp. JMULE4]SDJ32215.1 raffinose/stachyose/melibiose transport system permease protein [Paenibacillus naphthalenovorans]